MTSTNSCDEVVRLLRQESADQLLRHPTGKLLTQKKCRGTIRATVSNLIFVGGSPSVCTCEKYNGEWLCPQVGTTCDFNSEQDGGSTPFDPGDRYGNLRIWWDTNQKSGPWGVSPGNVWRMQIEDVGQVPPGITSWWYCAKTDIRGITPGQYCPIGNWILTAYQDLASGCLDACGGVGTWALVTTEWVE